MTKTVKITKAMILSQIKANVENMVFEGEVTADDVIAYVDTTLEQMAAKNAKAAEKRAEKKAANDDLKDAIAKVLTDEFQTGEQIVEALDMEDVTKNKVASRMKVLIEEKVAVKGTIKDGKRNLVGYKLA